jgi:hypothetical protein
MKRVVLVVLTGMFGGALLLQSCEKDVFEPNGGNPSNNDTTYVDPNDSTNWNGGGGNNGGGCNGGDSTIWNGGGGNPGDSTNWNGGGGNNGGDSTIWNGGGGNPGDSLPNGN